ncbi:hypothetical protein KEJ26_04605 [Candidatus Bathyarchaeota archaeon]|nr:hypothetical protein [Candidatus Bathyarchaeota archaeon]
MVTYSIHKEEVNELEVCYDYCRTICPIYARVEPTERQLSVGGDSEEVFEAEEKYRY